ncbi:MAG TPA: hypothetical protein VEO92_04000 [Candidatus Nitrosocosmicus sp.]|nr:hypothetical protein [Candidatus Nitrosocosmicus sp.]
MFRSSAKRLRQVEFSHNSRGPSIQDQWRDLYRRSRARWTSQSIGLMPLYGLVILAEKLILVAPGNCRVKRS